MNTGMNLRILGNVLDEWFTKDKYGSLIANMDSLQVEHVAEKMRSELSSDKSLARQLRMKTFTTDVKFSFRPHGATPVIANGIKLFGPMPEVDLKFMDGLKSKYEGPQIDQYQATCSRRNRRITNWIKKRIDFTSKLDAKSDAEELLKQVEIEQIMTGGGYDGTDCYQITQSALDFLAKSAKSVDLKDSWRSKLLMEQILAFREELWKELGNPIGKLRHTSLQLVRYLQETDGMMGWPVYSKARVPLTKQIARRISNNTGVDVMHLVDNVVRDPNEGNVRQTYVVDGVAYALDNMVIRPRDVPAIIHTLARIQRHGYKYDNGELTPKKGKGRSVSPNSAIAGAQEAMAFTAFERLCKDKFVSWLPSKQTMDVRNRMIKDWYLKVLNPKDYTVLAADWSGYDKTVDGSVLATILYYVVRPLYHRESQAWIDLAIISLVYKYFIISKTAASSDQELYAQCLNSLPHADIDDEFMIFGTCNGLGSGAKMTHVGGSLYGEIIIHHCLPVQLGYEGVSGPQAGDDTSLGIPRSLVNLASVEETYSPISKAASEWNLELNVSKQIWVIAADEPVNIFLQYAYHNNLGIWGIGTAARYSVAIPFAEKSKGLSISEQYLAVLSKINNGWNSPFIKEYVRLWLSEDDLACALFKEKGVDAFNVLTNSIGLTIQELNQRLDLTFNWGLSADDLNAGRIPVLPIIADVASQMSPRMSISEVLKKLGETQLLDDSTDDTVDEDVVDGPDLDEESIGTTL